MKIKTRLWLAISLVLLLTVSMGVGVLYIRTQLAMTPVIIARHALAARSLVKAEDLVMVEVPNAYLSDQVVREADEIIGTYVVLDGFIPEGSLIYRSMTEKLDEAIDEPALLLKAGQAVLSLDVGLSSTAGNTLLKGQKVDLYGTVKINRETIVDILLKQVRVVGLKDKNGIEVTHSGNQIPKVLLLAVEQAFIPVLTKLLAIGDLTLTPTAYAQSEQECMPNVGSTLWEYLDVQ